MNYFTTDLYETKRDIVTFSKHLSKGLTKPEAKFVMDMQYGISASQNILISNIARTLQEPIKLGNTIERLCNHLNNMSEETLELIKRNYYKQVVKTLPNEPLVLLDDTEIVKLHGKKFEDLCMVRDASAVKETIAPGYYVCEATVVTEKEKQPISLFSHIYSTNSKGFISKNDETLKSIKAIKQVLPQKCTFVGDRGYDANVYYKCFLQENNNDDFVIRLKENRNLLFKNIEKNVGEIARKRKGKIKMNLYFQDLDKEVYISHTKVSLPCKPKQTLTLVIVYGLSEENPMLLLTNKMVSCKEDVIRIVRAYMSRWRIEEHFHFKKEQYDFEDMRVRTLKGMNALNTMLMIHIGYIGILAENINKKLLVIKLVERSKSLKNRAYMWFYQVSNGIVNVLKYAHHGVQEFHERKVKERNKQLQFNLIFE